VKEYLNPDELSFIIAEVDKLARRYDAQLDREKVREILQELNLPPELLDEALVELKRREALAARRRRNRLLGAGFAFVILGAIAGTALWFHMRQQKLARIEASGDYLTLTREGGEALQAIARQASPEVYYRVTLQEAPMGTKLDLKCNWIDPNGEIAHQNRYQTNEIDKEVWPTYCRHQFNTASPDGMWKVEMRLGDRVLEEAEFKVK
jgi:hypothetical protein